MTLDSKRQLATLPPSLKKQTNNQTKKPCGFIKIGKDIAFTSGKNLQQILCQKNKPKLLPKS